MAFSLKIDTDNAAFDGSAAEEVSRILAELANNLAGGYLPETLRDVNGNTVGTARFTRRKS